MRHQARTVWTSREVQTFEPTAATPGLGKPELSICERTGPRGPVLDFRARTAKAVLDLESINLAIYFTPPGRLGPLQRPLYYILVN